MSGLVYILGSYGSLQQTLLWGSEFLLPPQLPQVFIVRGLGALFSWAGILGCVVCLTSQLFCPIYLHANVGPLVGHPLPCCESSLSRLPVSAPPTSRDECFFFNSLVVGLPYSSIFWQFWLFFVFKLVVVLLLVVWGGKVYLLMSPYWPEVPQNAETFKLVIYKNRLIKIWFPLLKFYFLFSLIL